jgi:hypothetical protein
LISQSRGLGDVYKRQVLTAREHFVCHLLLPKMLTGINKRNMIFAIWSMMTLDHSVNRSRHKVSSRTYTMLKKQVAQATSQLHKGKVVSGETKKKISEKAKGRTSPNKGKAMSQDQKDKLSVAHTGKIIAPETVEKILEARKGYQHSEETKQKISDGNKGKSVIISEETKKKISNSLKGRPNANKGKPAFNQGIPHSDATKQKIRLAAINRPKLTCQHCGKQTSPSMHTLWHGDNCKNK